MATVAEIIERLSRDIPREWLKSKKMGGNNITYIPWHHANKLLDQHAPGWQWEVRSISTTNDQIFVVGRLIITADDGQFYREATGTESLKVSGYGDPSSNAESMAFRRAAAKFGLGLYLYDKDSYKTTGSSGPQRSKQSAAPTKKPSPKPQHMSPSASQSPLTHEDFNALRKARESKGWTGEALKEMCAASGVASMEQMPREFYDDLMTKTLDDVAFRDGWLAHVAASKKAA